VTVVVNASLASDDTHTDMAKARPGDTTEGEASAPCPRGHLLDLVVHSPNPSLPGGPAPGEMTQASKSLSVVDLGVIKLGLSGYPGASSPPVGWSQVEGSAEQACLRVATADKLLWEAMAMVG
jgi:hypothetical protein